MEVSDEFWAACIEHGISVQPPGCFTPSSGRVPVLYCATNEFDAYVQGFCSLSPHPGLREGGLAGNGSVSTSVIDRYQIGTLDCNLPTLDYASFAEAHGLSSKPNREVGEVVAEALHSTDGPAAVLFESGFGVRHDAVALVRAEHITGGESASVSASDQRFADAMQALSIDIKP